MVKKTQRTNNISLKLSDDEKKRVTFFAGQRDLSVAEYLRMSALGHKIKPTIVEWPSLENVEPRSDHSNEASSSLLSENELRIEISKHESEVIKQISQLIAPNGYIDYRKGGKLMLELKKIAERFNEI